MAQTQFGNFQLQNSSVTIGSTSVALGATATTLAGVTLTTPTIASFTNATHSHTNAAGGGQLTDAALSTAVTVSKGGTGATTLTSGSFLQGNGTSAVTATKTVPTGAVVGTTDIQTLTNKTVGDYMNITGQTTLAAATAGNARLYGSGTTNVRPKWINESAVVEDIITTSDPSYLAWTSWTPTLSGWSSNPTGGLYYYQKFGKTVHLVITQPNNGTSNATTCVISLPFTAVTRTSAQWGAPARIVDNGTIRSTPGWAVIASNGTNLTVVLDYAFNAFTTSGGKRVDALTITYESV